MPINLTVLAQSAGLLVLSNIFMTVAWYAHLKNLSGKAWYVAAAISWSLAFFEYMFQVPANRISYKAMALPQLKDRKSDLHVKSGAVRLYLGRRRRIKKKTGKVETQLINNKR